MLADCEEEHLKADGTNEYFSGTRDTIHVNVEDVLIQYEQIDHTRSYKKMMILIVGTAFHVENN